MPTDLTVIVNDFADGLCVVDASGASHKQFKPGIGPFGEADATKAALTAMKASQPIRYGDARTRRHPDLLIPKDWQIELKLVRPYGDNGKEAEGWSQNTLHPYAGSTSSIGDCFTLLASKLSERRAILVFGYEHSPARISLEPCIRGFEVLAKELCGLCLSPRIETIRSQLIHPEHQVLRVYGWEVLRS